MGSYQLGVPKDFVLSLKAAFGIKNFIETGTHLGSTALWATDHFDKTFTIEASDVFFRTSSVSLASKPGICTILGDSRAHLPKIIAKLSGSALFWLDGHYSGGDTFGEKDECPLLEEIECINASKEEHFILIDDARLFTAPPPQPHDALQWPTIDVVCQKLQQGPKLRYILIYEDVIYAVPMEARAVFLPMIQSKITSDFSKHSLGSSAKLNNQGISWFSRELSGFFKKCFRFVFPRTAK